MSQEDVKRFWDKKAADGTIKQEVTHSDIYQRMLEIDSIRSFLRPDDTVLDIGCGNGYSTRRFAGSIKSILGLDYSQEMIDQARKAEDNPPNVSYRVCDIREADGIEPGTFSAAITERCLINLADWEEQQQAILNIHKSLEVGGTYVFCEGKENGRRGLNELRKKLGLEEMPKVWHNVDFEEKRTREFLSKYFDIEKELSFGMYDLISRVVHPLAVQPNEPQYDSAMNQIAYRMNVLMNDHADISRVLFLVLKKR
ncbi:MAG: class I SAM-dependent methyltransferase [Candidatus Omnitrophica bacterium]|nr:class I SAM-dependent methyltransferase [Candidatus Omnitrophota bacterium]